LGSVNEQIAFVCGKVRSDPQLAHGFNALGFSQGSQFLRGYVERCNNPPVYNLVTYGGQHQGVAEAPGCMGNATLCEIMDNLLALGAYNPMVQKRSIQAQYFNDPMKQPEYLKESTFIADINNERPAKNATYKANFMSLNAFVMVKFLSDTVVVPRASEWFGKYKTGSLSQEMKMEDTDLYTEDWIGLRALNEAGKVVLKENPGQHMRVDLKQFTDDIVKNYFDNQL